MSGARARLTTEPEEVEVSERHQDVALELGLLKSQIKSIRERISQGTHLELVSNHVGPQRIILGNVVSTVRDIAKAIGGKNNAAVLGINYAVTPYLSQLRDVGTISAGLDGLEREWIPQIEARLKSEDEV